MLKLCLSLEVRVLNLVQLDDGLLHLVFVLETFILCFAHAFQARPNLVLGRFGRPVSSTHVGRLALLFYLIFDEFSVVESRSCGLLQVTLVGLGCYVRCSIRL